MFGSTIMHSRSPRRIVRRTAAPRGALADLRRASHLFQALTVQQSTSASGLCGRFALSSISDVVDCIDRAAGYLERHVEDLSEDGMTTLTLLDTLHDALAEDAGVRQILDRASDRVHADRDVLRDAKLQATQRLVAAVNRLRPRHIKGRHEGEIRDRRSV